MTRFCSLIKYSDMLLVLHKGNSFINEKHKYYLLNALWDFNHIILIMVK